MVGEIARDIIVIFEKTPVSVVTHRDVHTSGVIKLHNGVTSGTAGDALGDFMVVFGENENLYTVADGTRVSDGARRAKSYLCGQRIGIPIFKSNVLILDRGAGCTDGFWVAGLVVLVARRGVFGGDGKASRVARDW